MNINALGTGNNQQIIQRSSEKLRAVIESLVSGSRINRASDDVAALSIATQLQTGALGLRQASNNLAQASSLTQVADGGIQQVQNIVKQLQSLASQAQSPTLSSAARSQLNEQFQSLSAEIDRIVGGTTFNQRKLLDGSLQGENSVSIEGLIADRDANADDTVLTVGDLSTDTLFGGEELDISTSAGAAAALEALAGASSQAVTARTNVGAFQQAINFIGANIESAYINQQAAASLLTDTDFAEASTQFSLANLQRNVGIALAAQGNNLSPSLLRLVS